MMGTKTIEIPHEGGHFLAPAVLERELAKAVEAAGVPEGWTVKRSETESGVSTKVTVEFEGEPGEPQPEKAPEPEPQPQTLAGETADEPAKKRRG
jgi:hypothetical protein